MGRIVRTRQAREDVLSIWSYIAEEQHALKAADGLIEKFDKTLQALARNPLMGTRQDRYREGLRCFPVGKYIIFYEPVNDGIRVIRVLHGARRLEDYF